MSDLVKFNDTLKNPKTEAYLKQVLGNKKDAFVVNLTALVNNNTNLQSCEPLTLMYAALRATALDLPLDQNLGFAYVIPYKNNKKNVTEAQFQIGVKGFKQLAYRSNDVLLINDGDVREGEIKKFDYLSGQIEFEFIQDYEKRKNATIVGYFSYFKTKSGQESLFYMSKKEVEDHARRYSKAFNSDIKYNTKMSLWSDADMFDSMARKTVTKLNLSKNAPLSITKSVSEAIQSDQSVIRENNQLDYVDRLDPVQEVVVVENPLAEDEAKTDITNDSQSNSKKSGQQKMDM